MKTELETHHGLVTIRTLDDDFSITMDVVTGVVTELHYLDATIHQLNSFISKAKTRYNKFLNSENIKDFIR